MKRKFETKAIHIGNRADDESGAVTPAIHLSSTFIQDEIGKDRGYDYSRAGNPTRSRFEENIASLENGSNGIAFSSGMSAISALFQTLNSGDHIIISRNVYGGTYRVAVEVFSKQGLEFDFVDTTDINNVKSNIKPNTKWVFIETPTNPLLEVTDIKIISLLCSNNNIKLNVDNTFLSPYAQSPLDLGADCVMHSTTKFIGGHSDVLGGILITNNEKLSSDLRFIQKSVGAVPSPFDCWLLLRSTKTLALRVAQASKTAAMIAKELDKHPQVRKVIYPGLKSHPGHELAKKQQLTPDGKSIFGSMISIVLNSEESCNLFLKKTKVFTLAESLGGVESLVCSPYHMTHVSVPKNVKDEIGLPPELLRLSIGIEHADDILNDILQAL